MQKTVLNEVFELLRQIDIVNSESEFSIDWLGRSECYLRTIRYKETEPSIGAMAICASKLQHHGKRMLQTEAHQKLGERFLSLSEKCHEHINSRSKLTWMCQ
jgi:hypothetical protein